NADRPFVVLPRSETEFFAETTDAEIELIVEQEEVQALVVRARDLATSPMWGPPLDAATAEPMLAEIEARYASQAPQPGADEIVRRIARVLAGEETLPADGGDDFDSARAIRDALERDRPDAFAARGNLVSIDFDPVNTMGQDVYRVVFERLAFDIVLGLNAAGTVASLVYRIDEAEAA